MTSRRGLARLGALLVGVLAPYLASCGPFQETLRNDTWTSDGQSWTQQHLSLSPPPRSDGSMAYHAATGTILLFGGIPGSGAGHPVLGDTWNVEWTSVGRSTRENGTEPKDGHQHGRLPGSPDCGAIWWK